MPMLYGEGHRAFIRLLEEIIRSSNDQSILVWSGVEFKYAHGLLAPSPAAFANSGNIMRSPSNTMSIGLANKGIHVQVETARDDTNHTTLFAPDTLQPLFMSVLNCQISKPDQLVAICLQRMYDNIFTRYSMLRSGNDRCWMTVVESEATGGMDPPFERSGQEDAYVPQPHREEKPFSYEDFYVDMIGFEGRMKWTMYPQYWPVYSGTAVATGYKGVLTNAYLDGNEYAGIRFTANSSGSEDFVVLLERQTCFGSIPVLLASIFMLKVSEGLVDSVLKLAKKQIGIPAPNAGPGDRVSLQCGKSRINVVMKRRLIEGVRRLMVEISLKEFPTLALPRG